MFVDNLKDELKSEKRLTENGAVGYATSGKKLLDLNFKVASFRSKPDPAIEDAFSDAFYESPMIAVKWLFYCRDARGGIGERRIFRVCMNWLADNRPDLVIATLPFFAEYGRWDDILDLLDNNTVKDAVVELIRTQLVNDYKDMIENKSVSLLAKWLPRTNTSSAKTKARAKQLCKLLGAKESEYRKTIAKLNKYLKTIEVSISKNEWDAVNYEAVPSGANLLYRNAFLKHDEDRRRAFLDSIEKGEKKINASVLFPHDIVHRYTNGYGRVGDKDTTLEELWKALPDYVNGAGNTIVVADGSGSMTCSVGNTMVTALDVANALAIYFAERSNGQFKDFYITFSGKPQLVDFSKAKSLKEKIKIACSHSEVSNTNVQAVFDLILKTAVDKNMKQEELPSNVLIISDMEFDSCNSSRYGGWDNSGTWEAPTQALFDKIAQRYEAAGYKLPRLVFWNVNSRTCTIPVQENALGVALVSGFSPAIANMVLSGELDPFKCLLAELNKPRYDQIQTAIMDIA